MPGAAHLALIGVPDVGQLPVRETVLLGGEQQRRVCRLQSWTGAQPLFHFDNFADVVQEPAVDLRPVIDVVDADPGLERVADVPDALGVGHGQLGQNVFEARLLGSVPTVRPIAAKSKAPCLQAAQGFLQRLLECPADGHRLADRLHLRGQGRIGVGEFLEIPARHLGYDVVDGRLEASRRLARDVVA